MANLIRSNGSTSNIFRVYIRGIAAPYAGKTGLSHSTSGLKIGTIANNEATAVVYTQAGSTIETITTLGTYAAPTATKCRFKEVDSTNLPGMYELQLADARFAVSRATSLVIEISGASDAGVYIFEVDLAASTAKVDRIYEKVGTASLVVQTDGTLDRIPADWPRA